SVRRPPVLLRADELPHALLRDAAEGRDRGGARQGARADPGERRGSRGARKPGSTLTVCVALFEKLFHPAEHEGSLGRLLDLCVEPLRSSEVWSMLRPGT